MISRKIYTNQISFQKSETYIFLFYRNLLKMSSKYFVKISNLEIIGNFKLIFLAEHVLMTVSGMQYI